MTKVLVKSCLYCGKKFSIYRCRLREKPNRGRFCCRKCVDEFKKINGLVANENNPAWTGDNASYSGFHRWLMKRFEKKDKCERCGKSTETSDGRSGTQWAIRKGRNYSRNVSDYMELCIKCHIQYDRGKWTDEKGNKHPMVRDSMIGVVEI